MNLLAGKNFSKNFTSNRNKICQIIYGNLINDLKHYRIV